MHSHARWTNGYFGECSSFFGIVMISYIYISFSSELCSPNLWKELLLNQKYIWYAKFYEWYTMCAWKVCIECQHFSRKRSWVHYILWLYMSWNIFISNLLLRWNRPNVNNMKRKKKTHTLQSKPVKFFITQHKDIWMLKKTRQSSHYKMTKKLCICPLIFLYFIIYN